MKDALRAEWTKQRTVTVTGWLLLATAVLTVARQRWPRPPRCAARPAGCAADPAQAQPDRGRSSARPWWPSWHVLTISGEYSTGMIRTTFDRDAAPDRGADWPRRSSWPGWSWWPAPSACSARCWPDGCCCPGTASPPRAASPPLSLTDGPTLRAAAGSVLYLVLIALLSLGVAAAVA